MFLYKKMTFGFRFKMEPSSIICKSGISKNVLENLHKMKIRDSVQLQTALATNDQEIDRDRAMPIYRRLKTKVSRRIEMMIRTHISKARNESPSQGVLCKCEPQEHNQKRRHDTSGNVAVRLQRSMGLAETVHELKSGDKATFHSPTEMWVMLTPSSEKPEER